MRLSRESFFPAAVGRNKFLKPSLDENISNPTDGEIVEVSEAASKDKTMITALAAAYFPAVEVSLPVSQLGKKRGGPSASMLKVLEQQAHQKALAQTFGLELSAANFVPPSVGATNVGSAILTWPG